MDSNREISGKLINSTIIEIYGDKIRISHGFEG